MRVAQLATAAAPVLHRILRSRYIRSIYRRFEKSSGVVVCRAIRGSSDDFKGAVISGIGKHSKSPLYGLKASVTPIFNPTYYLVHD